MSNSRAKYEELRQQEGFVDNTHNQRSMTILLEVLHAANKANMVDVLIDKAWYILKGAPNLTPLVIFQLAAEEAKVDELCN
jgi:hypothetical protein